MEHKDNNKVMVFDAKYKKMKFRGQKSENYSEYADLERSDFFQIHTYISYYESIGKEVIVGGLLYPIEVSEKDFINKENRISKFLFGGKSTSKTKFIVDGIVIPKEFWHNEEGNLDNLIEREKEFLSRIRDLIHPTDK
jgi:5-methylcytosine-specific restriction endonuclease McrBC regulatory subunit McrC